jgi:hypothetical protein
MPQMMYPTPMPGMHPNVFTPQVPAGMVMSGFIPGPPGHYGGGVPMYGASIPQGAYGMGGMMGGIGGPSYGTMFAPHIYPDAGMLPSEGAGTGGGGGGGVGGGGGGGEGEKTSAPDPASG